MIDLKTDELNFLAEIREIKTRKTVSMDMEHSIRLVTDNSNIVELSKFPADTLFKITISEDKD